MAHLLNHLQISAVAPPPIYRNMQGNGPNPSLLGADGSPRSTINSTMPAPRRKFVDEGKLRKVKLICSLLVQVYILTHTKVSVFSEIPRSNNSLVALNRSLEPNLSFNSFFYAACKMSCSSYLCHS